jgi:hypothetical protein
MTRIAALAAAALLVACASGRDQPPSQAETGMSHVHMGHVLTAWQDRREQRRLLPTAQAEAEVAARRAGFAASKPEDLAWMQMHVRHVMHAVDPSAEPRTLTQAIVAGTDANGDGTVGWGADEGGLAQAAQRMQFMKDGEGMA